MKALKRLDDSQLFAPATAAIVVHIADDELPQREPGTSLREHLVAGLVPIADAIAYPRLRAGLRIRGTRAGRVLLPA
jgi:hypothetical protein